MPHRKILPLAASAGGVATAAAGAMAQTANDAAGAVGQGGATVAWAGAAMAFGGLAINLYLQFRQARLRADTADAEARLQQDTREHTAWGEKYESELDRRVRAEARLKIVEEHVVELKQQIERLTANVKQAGKVNAEIGRHNAATLDSLKHDVRKARAEVRQIASPSSSGIGLDETVTPVPDPPKPSKPK